MARRLTYADVRRARKTGSGDFTRKDWLRMVVTAFPCTVCGAARQQPCIGVGQPHAARRKALIELERRAAAQRLQRRSPVSTRFVCPLCGGEHTKQDHQSQGRAEQQLAPGNATVSPASAGDERKP